MARYGVPVAQGYGIIEVGLPIMNIAEAAEHPEAIGRPLVAFRGRHLRRGAEADGRRRNRTARFARPGHVRRLPEPGAAARRSAARGLVSYRRPGAPRRRRTHRAGWAHLLGHQRRRPEGVPGGSRRGAGPAPGGVAFARDARGLTRRPGKLSMPTCSCATAGRRATREEMLAFCRQRLSNYKVPTSLEMVTELSLTSSGKVRHG